MKKVVQTAAVLLTVPLALNMVPVSVTADTKGKKEKAEAAKEAKEEKKTEVVTINSIKEFMKFAKDCTIDSYSQGKQFVLATDLDLAGSDFSAIPIFCGEFDGAGHTISHLNIKGEGSHMGLFRYIAEGAEVKNLIVKGEVAPEGTSTYAGGLAGSNAGRITDCEFSGTVSGIEYIGGIAGENKGVINNTKFDGTVTGEHEVGGIVGTNSGVIIGCKNLGAINTTPVEGSSDIGVDISNIADSVDIKDFDISSVTDSTFLNITNIGGIAGDNSGTIQDSKNKGDVGYIHIGYNVAGIAGTSSGYVTGCSNSGTVIGRRDTGGIVGQQVPYAVWDFSNSKIEDLETEIDELDGLVKKAKDHLDANNAEMSGEFDSLLDYTHQASGEMHGILDRSEANVAAAMSSLNQTAAIVNQTVQQNAQTLAEAAASLRNRSTNSTTTITIPSVSSNTNEAAAPVETAPVETAPAETAPAEAASSAAAAVTEAAESVTISETPAPADTASASTEGTDSAQTTAATDYTTNIANTINEASSTIVDNGTVSSVVDGSGASNYISGDAVNDAISYNSEAMQNGAVAIGEKIDNKANEGDTSSSGSNTGTTYDITAEDVANAIDTSKIQDAKQQGAKIQNVIESTNLQSLNTGPMFNALNGVYVSASALSDTVYDTSTTFSSDLDDIMKQVSTIFDQFLVTMDNLGTVKTDYENDISVKNAYDIDTGAVDNCVNTGLIQADADAGGIAGNVNFEVSFDMEDTLNLNSYATSDASHLIFASIRDCESRGEITARDENAGGIAGILTYGAIVNSAGSGAVSVENGSYAGGIAGNAVGTILNSTARVKLNALSYVGGIAGKAGDLADNKCYSVVEGNEYIGSVAGYTEGELTGNTYVEDELGAIDGVSYAGLAEPVSYETVLADDSYPESFRNISVTYMVDGEVYEVVEVPFGESVEEEPAVPNDGETYWKWDDYQNDHIYANTTVEGHYYEPDSTIATGETVPMFLAEGTFYEGQVLSAEEYSANWAANNWDAEDVVAAYTVGVNDYNEALTVRMRLEDATEDTILYVRQADGTYKKTNFRMDGSYAVFNLENGASFVFIEDNGLGWPVYVFAGLIGTALVAAAAAIIIRRRRKNRPEAVASDPEPVVN